MTAPSSFLGGVLQSLVLAGDQSDQSGTHTAAVLRDADANLLLARGANLGNLTQSIAHVALEVRVEFDQTAVHTNVDHVAGLDLAGVDKDSRDRDGAQTSGTLTNGVNQNLDSLALLVAGLLNLQVVLQRGLDVAHLLGGVGFDLAQQAGIQAPLAVEEGVGGNGDLGGLAGLEKAELGVVVHREQSATQDLTQEHARDTLLEHLHTGVVAVGVQLVVEDGAGQHAHVVVKATPFGVDDHFTGGLVVVGALEVFELGDILELLDVGAIGTGSKDGSEESAGLTGRGIGAGHQGTNGVVDQGCHAHGKFQRINGRLEQGAYIVTNGIGDVEALGPPDQGSGVDSDLAHGEAEGESQIEHILFAVTLAPPELVCLKVLVVMNAEEGLDLAGQEEEEVLGGTGGHEFPGNHDLGLSEVEGGVAVQLNRAHAEVGPAEVDGQVETLRRILLAVVWFTRAVERYLFGAIGHSSDEGRDLAQSGVLLLQTFVGLLDVFGNPALHLLGGEVEVTRDARGLLE